jgi:D-serine deaminase-like pyridoxal phosphate-dependent protein
MPHAIQQITLLDAAATTLQTPAPLVDLDRFERNLNRMAEYTARHKLGLRPHAKTHKSSWVGSEQIRTGAGGFTCATPRELEVMGTASNDLLLAHPPVGAPKLERLMRLPEDVRLTVALDSVDAVKMLHEAAVAADRPVAVYVELDVGMHRVGVTAVEDAIAIIRAVVARAPLTYAGIAFYPGHIRDPIAEHDAKLEQLNEQLRDAIDALDAADLHPAVVSGGSTPTEWRSHEIYGVTEIRPGTYIFNDRMTAEIGVCTWDDCALSVLATVVSTSVPGQVVIDAGQKALGREPVYLGTAREAVKGGYGALLDRPEVVVKGVSEEHGVLDLSNTSWRPSIGEQVRVVPNHACVTVHMFDTMYGVRGDAVESEWSIDARGR